jgi:hypothetical protein
LPPRALPPWVFHRENFCVFLRSLKRKACIDGVCFVTPCCRIFCVDKTQKLERLLHHALQEISPTFGARKEFYIYLPNFNHHEKVLKSVTQPFLAQTPSVLYIILYKILISHNLAFLQAAHFA